MNGPLTLVTTYDCAILLLQAGADPHHRDSIGRNAITAAATLLPDPRYISELLSRGVDVNGSINDHHALQFFKSHDKSLVEMLLDHGAHINGVDAEGNSLVSEFIWTRSDDSAQLLLERGADYTTVSSHGNNILHVVADAGSLNIVHILRAAALRGIDVEALNKVGQTPWDAACQRSSRPEGFLEAFRSLLIDVDQRNAAQELRGVEIVNEDEDGHEV